MKYIKLFGIQRTGTNFIQQLCQNNMIDISTFDNRFGWKHALPKTQDGLQTKYPRVDIASFKKKIHPVIMIKNPYSWHQSIRRWTNKKYDFDKLYERYNSLYKKYKYFHLNDKEFWADSMIIKYEDLLAEPKKIVGNVASLVGCEMKDKFLVLDKVPHNKPFNKNRKAFYLGDEKFGLSAAMIKRITVAIDWDTIQYYGYNSIKIT